MPAVRPPDINMLPAWERRFVNDVGKIAFRLKCPVYLVGGSVRDLALGLTSNIVDLDIVVEGDYQKLAEEIGKAYSGEVTPFPDFLTAVVKICGRRVDIVRARSESYPVPGENPVVRPAGLREDLARRDFTINAMALSLSDDEGHLRDPYSGLSDLRQGLIRVLYAESFWDDPTRILRAVRFKTRLFFNYEGETELWMKQAVEEGALLNVPGERIHKELVLCTLEPDPAEVFLELVQKEIFRTWFPGFSITSGKENLLREIPRTVELLHPRRKAGFSLLPLFTAVLVCDLKKRELIQGLLRMGMSDGEVEKIIELCRVRERTKLDPDVTPRDQVIMFYLFSDEDRRRWIYDTLRKR